MPKYFGCALIAVLTLLAVRGNSQPFPNRTFSCTAVAGVPPIIRAEGITELVGDLLLSCTGGTPTAAGAQVPLSNIQVFLNTNITSRLVGSNSVSEALLFIDEPFPVSPVPTTATPAQGAGTQLLCGSAAAPFTGPSFCNITGTGDGTGVYSGSSARPNIFQGVQAAPNSISWTGIPIDPPPLNGFRTIRITNVRTNASAIGTSSTLVPSQVVMFIAVNGSQQVSISNPQQTVGFIQPGLIAKVTAANLNQCTGGTVTGNVNVNVTEGFADAFRRRNIAVAQGFSPLPAPLPQNVPGFSYDTESGFYNPAVSGSAGLADFGTRILLRFNNVGTGVSLTVPLAVQLTGGTSNLTYPGIPSGGLSSEYLILVSTDVTQAPFTSTGVVAIANGTGVAEYEVLTSDQNAIETATIPVTVSFATNATLGSSSINVSFSPQSSVRTADATSPIPRFADSSAAQLSYNLLPCTCNLLFPFVTNQSGFDTGIVISNTSLDPFGTVTQTGPVTLNYYGNTQGGGAAPAKQVSATIPPGGQLVFTLSNGSGTIASTPGFQGYIIASANFQYCHGYAFISDLGARRLAEGYLALVLDNAAINRTTVDAEIGAH